MNSKPSTKPGRNEACPCGSGRKYKHCCAQPTAAPAGETGLQQLLETARYHAYQRRDFAAAEQCYRQVLELKPNHAEALAGVGQGLCWRHRLAEGKRYLARAAKALLRQSDKTDGRVLLGFAEQMQIWGDMDLALQLARAAAKAMPDNASAHYGVAVCLQRLHQTDAAIAALEKVLKLVPHDAGSHILLAILEFDNKQYDAARQRLERVVAAETDTRQLARACLELSKVYDKQKRYAEAFAMFAKAGGLQRQLPENQALDAGYIFKKIALFKQGYSDALLKRWTPEQLADGLPAPVFLIGFLRSGTTLTEQVLAAHPQVLTSDENHLLEELSAELAAMAGISDDTPAALARIGIEQARQLRAYYWQRVAEEFGPEALRKRFVNKVALNSIETGLISCLFPDAKILFALRDPRDVCLSCAMQSFAASPATVNLLSWQGVAEQYAAVMDLWLSLRDRIAPAWLELRYEDVVNDFEASFRGVFELLGVDWRPEVERFHERTAGRYVATPSFAAVSQPLYNSALARWRPYRQNFAELMPQLARFVAAFGYDEADL
ncbi:sulfotransferase [Methylomonas sp. HW2-6]|uniref:sulfotransferase n=1 Tax=Methylomonas sp. HW2-6 TaxID=3376687 RepID=UPI004041ED22